MVGGSERTKLREMGKKSGRHQHKVRSSGVMKASTGWDQSRERRGCRGTMLLSAAEKKVRVQTERHDNFCPPALCFAPYSLSPCLYCRQGPGRPPQVCPVLCRYNHSQEILKLPKIATEAKLCENHLKTCSFCPTVQNTVVLCLRLRANKAFRTRKQTGCKTKKNRAVATATGRQRYTVFSNRAVGINNASSVSGHMMAELKPTVLR